MMNMALGGTFPLYNRKLVDFMRNLIQSGAKLVCFMPGKIVNVDDATRVHFNYYQKNAEYLKYVDILDRIEQISSIADLENLFTRAHQRIEFKNFPMVKAYEFNLERMTRTKSEFFVNNDHHSQRIGRYANDYANEVLAIITNDTDFMAYNGTFQIWVANGINLNEMSGQRYNKATLYDKLELNGVHQVQLLGALCGSNHLPSDVLSHFHGKLAAEDPTKIGKIRLVSAYVKRQPYTVVDNEAKFDLGQICRDVFGGRYTPEQRHSIGKSLKYYRLDFSDDNSADSSFLIGHNAFLYTLATSDVFHVLDIEFLDFRHYDSKNYADLVIPILMKMCGILLKDHTERPVVRKICIKQAHDSSFMVVEKAIIYPTGNTTPQLFLCIISHYSVNFCIWTFISDKPAL